MPDCPSANSKFPYGGLIARKYGKHTRALMRCARCAAAVFYTMAVARRRWGP